MAYYGIKVENELAYFTIKLHGPDVPDTEGAETIENSVLEYFRLWQPGNHSQRLMCHHLADYLIAKYGDGHDIIWIEVEAELKGRKVVFGASAEKVLVR